VLFGSGSNVFTGLLAIACDASAIEPNYAYKVSSTIRQIIDREVIRRKEDVREIAVTVQNPAGTRTFASERAQIMVGGF